MSVGLNRRISAAALGSLSAAFLANCGRPVGNSQFVKTTEFGPNGMVTFLKPIAGNDTIEKIIGTNDLKPVVKDGENLPENLRPLIDAFGLLSMGCSATHIGNNIVLTAGHCFDAPSKRSSTKKCGSFTVKWGYRKDKEPFLVSKCTEILAYELNDDRDYAIFKVDEAPEAKVDVEVNAHPEFETKITIFGHPRARPLEWSQFCTVQSSKNGHYGKDQFSHQCDTEPGNSGSSIIADKSLKVVGIHDGGRVPWNYGTYISDTPIKEFLGGGSTKPTDPVVTKPRKPKPPVNPPVDPDDPGIDPDDPSFDPTDPSGDDDDGALLGRLPNYRKAVGHALAGSSKATFAAR